MTEAVEVYFHGDGGDALRILITDYLQSQNEDFGYGSRIRVNAIVQVTDFTGNISGYVYVRELRDFVLKLQQVYDKLSGTATFVTLEHWLSLEIQIDKLGHVHLHGFLTDYSRYTNRLSFTMESDQSYLASSIKQLKTILSRFPVRGQP